MKELNKKLIVTNKNKPWYYRGLFYTPSKLISISLGLHNKSFLIGVKKNGNTLDFYFDFFICYLNITLWDYHIKNWYNKNFKK